MLINNTLFTVDLLTVLTELRSQLELNGIQYLQKIFESGDDVMVSCPFHKNGQEKRPSAGIRKADGQFHCLACGETHSLPEVISYCFGYNDPFGREGFKWLTKNFLALGVENREDIKIDLERRNVPRKSSLLDPSNNNQPALITEQELEKYRYVHPYMYERGLTDDIIDMFDIGYDRSCRSITFPVRDINGDCRFVARRSITGKRFDLPKGIAKPLYGFYELNNELAKGLVDVEVEWPTGEITSYTTGHAIYDYIYVCEGLFDCLRLCCNKKPAVAGFGCLFNSLQIEQLNQLPTRKIILATDNDDAGIKARKILRQRIKGKLITEVIIPNGKKDIGECTDEEIQNLVEVF